MAKSETEKRPSILGGLPRTQWAGLGVKLGFVRIREQGISKVWLELGTVKMQRLAQCNGATL